MPEAELSAGTVDYEDTGGAGPVLVFLHGLTMDSSLWRPAIGRDLAKYATSVPSRPVLLQFAARRVTFDRPVPVAWATEDHMMPRQHGRRLAELFPNARLVEIDESYTLIPEDQPEQLAHAIRDFVQAGRPGPRR